MNDLRVCLIQGDTRWHDPAANRGYYGELIRRHAPGADLVVLPETFTSGFSNEALASAEGMDGPTLPWLRELAVATGAVITGSMQCCTPDGTFNRLLWVEPSGTIRHYDKRHLFRMAGEHTRYTAGQERVTCELKGWRIRPLICYDLRFPVFIRNRYGHEVADGMDYDLLLFVANWPAPRAHAWRTLLRARAIENLSYCIGVNRCGIDGNGIAYVGDSAALDFLGQPLVECGATEVAVGVTLSAAALAEHRARFPAHLDADDFSLL